MKKTSMKTNIATKAKTSTTRMETLKIGGKDKDDEDEGNKLVDNHNTFRS